MRTPWAVGPEALRQRLVDKAQVDTTEAEADLPPYLESFMAHLRLLIGVPFEYLVPDERLLPVESIRFFYLDRSWTDRLVDGVLAVGKLGTREQAHHQAHAPALQARLDNTEWFVRLLQRRKTAFEGTRKFVAPANVTTGFVLRSAAVSGWPHMEVRAYAEVLSRKELDDEARSGQSHSSRMTTLRLERLSPSVLIALFAGVPKLVVVEEPHHGVQLGVKHELAAGWVVHLRSGKGTGSVKTVPVPFRKGNRRVVHAVELRNRLAGAAQPTDVNNEPLPAQNGSAAFAIELLDVPWRQRFEGHGGIPHVTGTGAFVSEFNVAAMAADERTAAIVRKGIES